MLEKNFLRSFTAAFTTLLLLFFSQLSQAQIERAARSGFTWIDAERVDTTFGSGYSVYSAAWPIFDKYPGPHNFQMGLGSAWLSTQRTGEEPQQFYTTIEGGLGWWHDTRFGTKVPKFIMGGVSYNFHAWANGPGAGRSNLLQNGQRDWSSPGGKYGIAQLSNRLLWAPDGLNLAQSLNGELLGYGYLPLPITDPMTETGGQPIPTGNQCWTLFINSTNFKGPVTFFLPTFWTEPVLDDPSISGLFLDSRPSNPNLGFGVEHAESPALISEDNDGNKYAKIVPLQYPATDTDGNGAFVLNQVSAYSKDALWNDMVTWFGGGPAVSPGLSASGIIDRPFINNGGAMTASIANGNNDFNIDLDYIDNAQFTDKVMGFTFDLDAVRLEDDKFKMPEYFELGTDDRWHAISPKDLPVSTLLEETPVPLSTRPELTYLTPMDPECAWQDPNGPWKSPGPAAGPFQAEMGDGSTLTYYWYRFVDQPAIVQANLTEEMRDSMQARVELIHANWSHENEYLPAPEVGNIATLDPAGIVQPPAGLEVGYVPIVTRQEKSQKKVRVFIMAGQSNMQGYGTVIDAEGDPGSLEDVIQHDTLGTWSALGVAGDWNAFENAYLYFATDADTIRSNVTVGQGANPDLIGPELMFAHQLDECIEDPILIIKTAWGGKSLAEDFRPPSADGETGASYIAMIDMVRNVTNNLGSEFPDLAGLPHEISGFAWFQGWNDGASQDFLDEYESNLAHLLGDVRNDFNNPLLPIVIANSGHGGFTTSDDGWVRNMQEIVAVAQENIGCDDTTYGGSVGFVETKGFFIPKEESPQQSIHHFNNNALTFLNVGKALGNEMLLAINHMAFCYQNCTDQVSPGIVSIGNRVWNDLNRNGINEPNEPGIPGVSLVLWEDSDDDGVPDWQGFLGVRVTDENGYYSFSGLPPGPYLVFVWSVDNWDEGEPLHGFVSTTNFEPNADNDVDFDNNGFGNPFTDIKSGIVQLTLDGEPLGDGDPFNCFFDYDANGNNTVDFGFYDPLVSTVNHQSEVDWIQLAPNPVREKLLIEAGEGVYDIQIFNAVGKVEQRHEFVGSEGAIDASTWNDGVYYIKVVDRKDEKTFVQRIVKVSNK